MEKTIAMKLLAKQIFTHLYCFLCLCRVVVWDITRDRYGPALAIPLWYASQLHSPLASMLAIAAISIATHEDQETQEAVSIVHEERIALTRRSV